MKLLTSRSTRTALLFTSFLIPSTPLLVSQQDTVRTLTGTVTGGDKRPIEGAVIKVENEATKVILSYITDSNGAYTVKRLSGNTDYMVWAAWKGQRTKQKTLNHFDTATQTTIDFSVDTR